MPTKKAPVKKTPKAEYKGYLNVNLSAEQELEFDAWYASNPEPMVLLFDQMDFGYKLSFGIDDYNDGIQVSMYARSTKLAWAGWTLSAWAGDLNEAAALLFFKHHFIANQDWEQFTGRPARSHSNRG